MEILGWIDNDLHRCAGRFLCDREIVLLHHLSKMTRDDFVLLFVPIVHLHESVVAILDSFVWNKIEL